MSVLLEFLLDNEYALLSLEYTDCGGAPFLIWQMEAEGLEEIGSHAFSECKKLSKVTLPSSLKTIGANAFSGCKALKQITLGANLEYIDPTAFTEGAKKLTIIAPEGSYAAEFAVSNGYTFKPAK